MYTYQDFDFYEVEEDCVPMGEILDGRGFLTGRAILSKVYVRLVTGPGICDCPLSKTRIEIIVKSGSKHDIILYCKFTHLVKAIT